MKTVDEMIDDILVREGGYVDHPEDRGGPTKFGITQSTLSRYYGRAVTSAEVQALSVEVAREIYERNYYTAPSLNSLPDLIQPFLFDSAVNHGPRRAIRFLQSVCNQARYTPRLSEDGAVGPNTRRAANWAEREMGNVLLKALIEERRNFYRVIVQARPSQSVFLKGWMNRVNEFEKELA
ncbi:N-acetylmuramidase [Marinobacterium sp. D7]|uniref:glycoside hydrolase family 108 protein n=1 Tax=Marinobacterium ramblicola TaxID=2849041 RepID=UPI001C2D9B61|nr:N-acetylmuramidase [Marinobacterium ramblicola]